LLAQPAFTFFGLLLVLALSRVAHMVWLQDRVAAVDGIGPVLLGGLRMDVLVLSMLMIPAVLAVLVAGGRGLLGRMVLFVVGVYCTVWIGVFVFLELATPGFIIEFDRRPDRLFIEYLQHPQEVGAMLWKANRGELLLGVGCTALAVVGTWKGLRRLRQAPRPTGFLRRLALAAVLLPALFLGARSSLQHRPANASSVAFCSDPLMNDLALSSGYSVLYAVYSLKNEADSTAAYGKIASRDVVIALVRREMRTVATEDFVDPQYPTLHRQHATRARTSPLNLVVILEESLGAQFSARLGGRGLTPRLDGLAEQGWWFEQLYATGTRSVRGIEAVVSGFPPTPARSVVKLGKSQRDFFTLGSLLAGHGYHTQFMYGGESHFDDMRRFFTGNGFQEVIDRENFEDPLFVGSWGVSDDDMFNRLHEELSEAPAGSPLFSFAFSVSNHSPWDFPDLHCDTPPTFGREPNADNAVRYADAALGAFFDKARGAEYWSRTVFLVVADHDARVFGAELVPVTHFHIPALILGADVAPRMDPRVASQLDLPTTLLGLLGLDTVHPMIGRDMTQLASDDPGRAIMQYGDAQAYMAGDSVVIFRPGQEPACRTYSDHEPHDAGPFPELLQCGLAHALLTSSLYREQLYPGGAALTKVLAKVTGR